MGIFSRHSFALLAAVVVLAGCAHLTHTGSETRPAGARLTTAEAIEIAQQTAERDGRRLSDYKSPEAHYEFIQQDKSWWVFFRGRVLSPGNHFAVSIDDPTGKTRLIPGR
jgi:hypothetical protein